MATASNRGIAEKGSRRLLWCKGDDKKSIKLQREDVTTILLLLCIFVAQLSFLLTLFLHYIGKSTASGHPHLGSDATCAID